MSRWSDSTPGRVPVAFGAGVLSVVTAMALAACSVLAPPAGEVTDAAADLQPAPAGPVVEIASGEAGGTTWHVVAYVDATRAVCLAEIVSGSMSGSTCGPLDDRGDGIGPLSTSPFIGDDGSLVAAVLAPEARSLRVETSNGSVDAAVVSLAPLGVGAVAAALHLPPVATPTAVVALTGAGDEMGRRDLGPGL